MKTTVLQSLFKIALLLSCMAIGFGCDDSTEPDEPDSPDKWEVPRGPDTASYKVTGEGVCWKLANAVENGKSIKNFKEEQGANYWDSKTFTLSFEGNGTFLETGKYEGISSVNTIIGGYSTDPKEWTILITEKCATEVNESEFGYRYRELLAKVKVWAYLDECLYLYFGEDSYLEYELKSELKGMNITCKLSKTVENGTEIKYPAEIAPSLTLKKDLTFEGNAACNSIRGGYKYNADNGRFTIEDLITTELNCMSPYSEAESMYLGFLRKISSYKQEGESIRLYFGEDSYLEYELKSDIK